MVDMHDTLFPHTTLFAEMEAEYPEIGGSVLRFAEGVADFVTAADLLGQSFPGMDELRRMVEDFRESAARLI